MTNEKLLVMAKEQKNHKTQKQKRGVRFPGIPPNLIRVFADEVAKIVVERIPNMIPHPQKRTTKTKNKKIENAIFLDTSAIIDGRIFEIISLGLLPGMHIVLESVLSELKHIADSQDMVRRERGRHGLEYLEKLKKAKGVKVTILPGEEIMNAKGQIEVDDQLIKTAKTFKGRVITCDYNLTKKASIQGVIAININTLANLLKVQAVPGEALHIKVLHRGKDTTQGVGYLDDGTMIVVEHGSEFVDKAIDVIVLRVIQTSAGRILFAKKI